MVQEEDDTDPDASPGTPSEQSAGGPLRPGPATAAGPLRPGPTAASSPDWEPPSDRREVGTLEQRAAHRTEGRLRTVLGMPSLQATGWSLFILGGLIYLHGLWATADAVVGGATAPEQTVRIGGTEFLQGTVGIALAVLGLVGALVFTFVPVRREPRLVPGTLEFEVAADAVRSAHRVRRIVMWSGAGLFLVGLLVAAWPLQQTVQQGEPYRLFFGGVGYRVQYWGYLLAALGVAVTVPLATTLGTLERAAAVAEGALGPGHVRRVGEDSDRGASAPPQDLEQGGDAAGSKRQEPESGPSGSPAEAREAPSEETGSDELLRPGVRPR